MKSLHVAVLAAALSAGSVMAPARATFVADASCGVSSCAAGTKFFNDVANHDVSSFTGTVGGHLTGPAVTVTTTGNVDTGAGFATIKPVPGGTLTDLIFTPADDTLFSDFSFRGQLEPTGFTGTLDVKVTDQFGTVSTVSFSGIRGPNADFGRIGVVSNDGETIASVEVLTAIGESFKEFKQVEFSFVTPPHIPEPTSLACFGVGLAGVAISMRRRKRVPS